MQEAPGRKVYKLRNRSNRVSIIKINGVIIEIAPSSTGGRPAFRLDLPATATIEHQTLTQAPVKQ